MDSSAFETLLSIGFYLIFALVSLLVTAVVYIYMSIVNMRLFRQAGIEGWKAWIPIYNTCLQYSIAGYSMWYALVAIGICFVPFVGSVLSILMSAILSYQYAMAFTRNKTFGVLSIFFGVITYSILAFGNTYNHGYMKPEKLLNEYI